MMIEYNPAVGWQQQGGEGKQQTRYKAPGKGLRGPLSRAGGRGGWRAQRQRRTQTRTEGDNARTKECIV